MWRHKADELARRNDLGIFPEARKMALVAGDQVVRAGGVGALEEFVVFGVVGDFERVERSNYLGPVPDELEHLLL